MGDPTLSTNSTLTASPTVPTDPRATVPPRPRATVGTVDMVPLTASSPVTPTPACTASSTPAAKSLARTTKLPTRAPPPRPVTITLLVQERLRPRHRLQVGQVLRLCQ